MVRWIRRRPRRASQRTGCSSTTPSKGFPWCCSCRCSWWCKCSWMFKRFTLMPLMQMFMVKMIMKCSSAAPPIGSYLICKNPLLVWSISSDKIAYFNVLLQISEFFTVSWFRLKSCNSRICNLLRRNGCVLSFLKTKRKLPSQIQQTQ